MESIRKHFFDYLVICRSEPTYAIEPLIDENATRYFDDSLKKVYIEQTHAIEPFAEYLGHRYQDNCYYYSAHALMGLKPNDLLVRGLIGIRNYHHGWVEFGFEDKEYVFDSMIRGIIPKQEWYKINEPKIDYKKSQRDILYEYLNEDHAFKIRNGFWQFRPFATNADLENISYSKILEIDKDNGYLPTALSLARLEIYDSEIKRFIAYVYPDF